MPTATTATPCPCCSLPNTLQCRVRGGTATLIGFSEYTSPSTPPKKYLIQTLGGQWKTCNWTVPVSGTCAGNPNDIDREVYSGTYTYNATTGATTNAQLSEYGREAYGDGTTIPCSTEPTIDSTGTPAANFTPSYTAFSTLTTTQTSKTWDYPTYCFKPSGTFGRQNLGQVTANLSSEDSESNAITRLLAGAGGVWGSWINSGATGCTGTPPSCCLAKYQSRTTLFTFDYYEAEARVTATGLTPSTNYTVKIELYRRVYGTGSYEWYQTATVTGTSDGSGNFTSSAVTVTNTKGYETYAKVSSIFPT